MYLPPSKEKKEDNIQFQSTQGRNDSKGTIPRHLIPRIRGGKEIKKKKEVAPLFVIHKKKKNNHK